MSSFDFPHFNSHSRSTGSTWPRRQQQPPLVVVVARVTSRTWGEGRKSKFGDEEADHWQLQSAIDEKCV